MTAMRGFGILYVLLGPIIIYFGGSTNTVEQVFLPAVLLSGAGLGMIGLDIWLDNLGGTPAHK